MEKFHRKGRRAPITAQTKEQLSGHLPVFFKVMTLKNQILTAHAAALSASGAAKATTKIGEC